MLGAMRAGLRYVRHASELHAVLVRSGLFMLCGSALWALLPLIARRELGLSAVGYGVLLGCIGVGAITGAAVLPRVQQTLSRERIVAGATLLFALASTLLGFVRSFSVLCFVMTSAGIAWMALMSSFNVAAQAAVPAWVRARALAMFMLVSQGSMGVGSAIWGTVATHLNITAALVVAAGGLVLGLTARAAFQLSSETIDVSPSRHWPEPHFTNVPRPDDGPLLITIEYRVKSEDTRAFAEAMQQLSFVRRRDGAIYWHLFRDGADPTRHLEIFIAESWAEHMRQHERFSVADRAIEQRARVFHAKDTPVVVAHFISAFAGEPKG
jgi:MFS family permease